MLRLPTIKKDSLEYEFLPSALELEQRPASPLGRFLIWFILAIVVITLLWAILGKVEEVAVARGKVIPDGNVKVIQPLEEGIIKAIHVREGQRVHKGQRLMELDSTIKLADVSSSRKELLILVVEKEMLIAELNGTPFQWSDPRFKYLDEAVKRTIETETRLKDAREAEYRAKIQVMQTQVTRKQHEYENALTMLPVMQERYDLIGEETDSAKTLYGEGGLSRSGYIDKQKELNTAREDLETQKTAVVTLKDDLNEAKRTLDYARQEHQSQLLNDIQEKEKTIASLEGEVVKADKRYEYEHLRSPVNGTVHGLGSYSIGSVVTPAQPLAMIVPDKTELIVEATALNKDIGFIRNGQRAEIKLDTFPFQKYGVIKGKIVFVSPDAYNDEKMGDVYRIRVEPEKNFLIVNGRKAYITPGMTAQVEVRTGERRIIEFFLSPIAKYAKESLTLR